MIPTKYEIREGGMLIARFDETTGRKQPLREHSENVSRLCGEKLAAVELDAIGRLIGLVHDLGKAKPDFQIYIEKAAKKENVERGSVVHSTAGMCYFSSLKESCDCDTKLDANVAELCEYAVGAHHGIFDCVDAFGNVKLFNRMEAEADVLATEEAFFGEVPKPSKELIQAANRQFYAAIAKIPKPLISKKEQYFHIGMLARLVLSALMDADRSDSADFCSGESRISPPLPIDEMYEHCERAVADLEKTASGRINDVRKSISHRAAAAGALPCGAYRLNTPCGAGKTIASMRFALAHAKAHNKRRIFYIAPLLTILDQNVATIRKLVGGDDLVLEHTSDFDESEMSENEALKRRLATENWSSPVVATSMVRFLETLFAAQGSAVRRMHSLTNSVIIIDEVQSLPVKSITMFNAAVNFLTHVAGATVLLCTATLPASPDLDASIIDCSEAVSLDDEEREVFRRCDVSVAPDEMTYDELCSFTLSLMADASRLLLICNTKSEAAQLFRMLALGGRNAEKPFDVVHLSAAMCKAHRKEVLDRIISGKERLVCVSTQVVEAGVDVSFECVIRLAAGIDNIAQAAGRCNRNGEFGSSKQVYVVKLKDEKVGSLTDIKRAKQAFDLSIPMDKRFDPSDSGLINNYYYNYFRLATDHTNETLYPADADGLPVRLYDLLSDNKCGLSTPKFEANAFKPRLLWHAFGTAGRLYKAIDDDSCSVIVPYDENARNIICDLCSKRAKNDAKLVGRKLKEAGPYIISVNKAKLNTLIERNAMYMIELFDKNIYILNEGEYDRSTGLLDETNLNIIV